MRASDGRRAKKEGWFNWDGSTNLNVHYRGQRTVVDDFGDLLSIKRCSRCRGWFRMTRENFRPIKVYPDGAVAQWQPYCRPCERAYRRADRRQNPEKYHERYLGTYERIRADPKRYSRLLDTRREAARRERSLPDYQERARARRKRYREKIKADPKRYAEKLEKQRMDERLRRERKGGTIKVEPIKTSGSGPEVDAGPLLRFVEGVIARLGYEEPDIEIRFGVSARAVRAWRSERPTTRIEIVDRVLGATGMNWWDIYEKPANGHRSGRPEDVLRYIAEAETYIVVCLAFEGELVE